VAQKRDLLLQKIISKTMMGVDVDIEAIKSFAKTGSVVGFASLILYFVVDNIFKEPVYKFLGSEKLFILLLVILGVIVTAIILSKRLKPDSSAPNSLGNGPTVNYKNSSTHNGNNRF
jgi:hypothetical protein